MNQETSLSIPDIQRELNFGIVTLKFVLKRFRPWLSFERIDGHPYYSRNTIPILIKIQESLEAGLLPSEIDHELKTGSQKFSNSMKSDPIKSDPKMDHNFLEPTEDIRVSKDGLTLIKSLFNDIAIQQNRVAAAHEKRASAEERKAVAIEKRAEAEEKKAMAMNNIATALQEMNQHRRLDSPAREMVHTAAQVMTLETNQDIDLADLEDTGDTAQQDYPEIFNSPDPAIDLLEASEIHMDDLSDLIDEDILLEDPLVDVQNIPEIISQKPEDSFHTTQIDPPLDDLASLIDPEPPPVNPAKEEEVSEIDDLSRLIDEPSDPAMDDLSALIDAVSTQASPKTDLCPLSVLPDLSVLDDLSLLIEDSTSLETVELDDLSALINDTPSLKPDITPEENLKEYKAAVMKIILGLKTQDLSTEETTRRLNQDGVQTISGKSQWSEQSISQIYKFIDSAR